MQLADEQNSLQVQVAAVSVLCLMGGTRLMEMQMHYMKVKLSVSMGIFFLQPVAFPFDASPGMRRNYTSKVMVPKGTPGSISDNVALPKQFSLSLYTGVRA